MRHVLSLFLIFFPIFSFAQSFGFDDDFSEGNSILPFSLVISGEINAGPVLYIHDFKSEKKAESFLIWDIIDAKTNFDINGQNAQVFIGLNLSYKTFSELAEDGLSPVYPPQIIDELWLRGYFDRLSVQAGFIKLRWGRMFTPGPLDIINPLDFSDLTNFAQPKEMKIARPMVHASYKISGFTGIEAVFLPNFAGHRFAQEGRWVPQEFSNATSVMAYGIMDRAIERFPSMASRIKNGFPAALANFENFAPEFPDTSTIEYFQTGMRFNTVIGPCDFGLQYFYGNYMRPSVSVNGVDRFINDYALRSFLNPSYTGNPKLISPYIEYSRYHQIGIDYSQILFGFNIRAELAAHITNDYKGENVNVKNPFLSWAFGFDRDIIAGININVQCNETIRLLDDKVLKNPAMDCEGGDNITSTRLITQITKSFFREKLECKLINIWDIEDSGLVFIPSVTWLVNDTRLELSAGIFTGDENSELGQYRENSYIKLKLKYSF